MLELSLISSEERKETHTTTTTTKRTIAYLHLTCFRVLRSFISHRLSFKYLLLPIGCTREKKNVSGRLTRKERRNQHKL